VRFLAGARHQVVHRQDDEVVDHRGDDHKRDHRVDEIAVEELGVVDGEGESGEVGFLEDRGDERREQVLGKGGHHRGKRRANHHAHRHVDHVSP
jgi:hypothetical protein